MKAKHADIPWDEMVSMRNFVVHEYFGVSHEILWNTIQSDLPGMVHLLEKLERG